MSKLPFILVDAGDCKYGGWLSFTTHLASMLSGDPRCAGPMIVRLGKRNDAAGKEYADDWTCTRAKPELIASWHKHGSAKVIITATNKANAQTVASLARQGIPLVVHDPNDAGWALDALHNCPRPNAPLLVVIRQGMKQWAQGHGYPQERVLFLPHPYVRVKGKRSAVQPKINAITLSRLDWDKHVEDVVATNAALLEAGRGEYAVSIWGAENRLYTHHKLDDVSKHWRSLYMGPFGKHYGAAVGLARTANWVVDCSRIKQDGGGTQYTHLEAWDAEAGLIVHRGWLQKGGELQEGVNCMAYETASELAWQLQQLPPDRVIKGGLTYLAAHSPTMLAGSAELTALWGEG